MVREDDDSNKSNGVYREGVSDDVVVEDRVFFNKLIYGYSFHLNLIGN